MSVVEHQCHKSAQLIKDELLALAGGKSGQVHFINLANAIQVQHDGKMWPEYDSGTNWTAESVRNIRRALFNKYIQARAEQVKIYDDNIKNYSIPEKKGLIADQTKKLQTGQEMMMGEIERLRTH